MKLEHFDFYVEKFPKTWDNRTSRFYTNLPKRSHGGYGSDLIYWEGGFVEYNGVYDRDPERIYMNRQYGIGIGNGAEIVDMLPDGAQLRTVDGEPVKMVDLGVEGQQILLVDFEHRMVVTTEYEGNIRDARVFSRVRWPHPTARPISSGKVLVSCADRAKGKQYRQIAADAAAAINAALRVMEKPKEGRPHIIDKTQKALTLELLDGKVSIEDALMKYDYFHLDCIHWCLTHNDEFIKRSSRVDTKHDYLIF